jgi:hypothetical protein
LLVNQNIDVQLCTHVKNHNHHINYLNWGLFTFSHINLSYMEAIVMR